MYYNRNIIIFVLCILVAGCSTPLAYIKSELTAQDHMAAANVLEQAKDYSAAARKYAFVAEHYPTTSVYQDAVRKAALLNIHPLNSKTDFNAALNWLQTYLTLQLSPEEKENAGTHVALLKNIIQLQTELFHINDKNKKQLLATQQKWSREKKAGIQRIKELEKNLTQTQAQLEEMKEVDLRMHTRRVNGNEIIPVKKNNAKILKKDQRIRKKGNINTKKTIFYPYTIQVNSFIKKEKSIAAAQKSKKAGNIALASPALVPQKGYSYRVFMGYYKTFNEAKKVLPELKKQYPHAFIAKMPFAIQIETSASDEAMKKIRTELQSQGYMEYSVPNKTNDEKPALLVGAFKSEKEAATQAKRLQCQGFKPIVVQR